MVGIRKSIHPLPGAIRADPAEERTLEVMRGGREAGGGWKGCFVLELPDWKGSLCFPKLTAEAM